MRPYGIPSTPHFKKLISYLYSGGEIIEKRTGQRFRKFHEPDNLKARADEFDICTDKFCLTDIDEPETEEIECFLSAPVLPLRRKKND